MAADPAAHPATRDDRLFDDGPRADLAPARDGDAEFAYANRSARPEAARVRAVLEQWLADYAASDRADLRTRLRSTNDAQFHAAFFELYLHALLHATGAAVEVHPPAPGGSPKRPDFLVRPSAGEPFYLEAIVATDRSVADVGADARMHEVYDALNTLDSPDFFLDLRVDGALASPVPRKPLVAMVRRLLRGLDPDAVGEQLRAGGLDALPACVYEHDGWVLEVRALPKSPAARGQPGLRPLGSRFYGVQEVDLRTPLRDAVLKKARRYGALESPYVVAVNAVAQHLHNIDVMEALFGKEQFFVSAADPHAEPRMERARDGALVGPKGVQNARVSAVLVVSALRPWHAAQAEPAVYHNPWAERPALDALRPLPRYVPVGTKMQHENGTDAATLLALPTGWPAVADDE